MSRLLPLLTCLLPLCTLPLCTVGCHTPPHEHHETGTFSVTSPLRTATELTQEYVAQVHAIQHIEVRALERGYLQGIDIDEGETVRLGQKLFQIMPMIYQAEVQKARAESDLTELEYKNTKLLADKNIVSENELALSHAKVQKAKAHLSLAATHQSLTEIRAPFAGIMGRFHVRQGSLLDEGDLLTTLSDNSKVWVYFNVSEVEYLDYKSHPKTEKQQVKLMMANGVVFDRTGVVETIEADFNNETGNIAFRATFENPDGLLRHGETGKILMAVPLPDALLIPQKATFEVLDKKYVFVVDEKNVVHARPITVAAELPHVYVVGEGLSEKDKILLDGLRKVTDGVAVKVSFQKPSEVLSQLELPSE